MTLSTLGLAVLAGAGARWVIDQVGSLQRFSTAPALRVGVAVLLLGATLLDGVGRLATVRVPPVPPGQLGLPDPQLHLPLFEDPLYMLWSTDGFPRIVNGYSGFFPRSRSALLKATRGFPDERSVAFLRSLGVRMVVLHPSLARGTPWDDAATKSTSDLPLLRTHRDGVVLFVLDA
jgi:hypothetical protein